MIAPGRFQRSVLSFCAVVAVVGAATEAEAIPLLNGFGGPNGYGTSDHCTQPNDDGGYGRAIDLRPAFPGGLGFFGRMFTTFYLNTNGNITFNGELSQYTPDAFPVADQPMIAPWWADVDTRGGGQPTNNSICFHIEPNRIAVTWHNVGYYDSHNDRLNDFQMILSTSGTCTTGGDFDVEFRYNRCEWMTGDASGGMGGFGGTPAQVGFDAGNRRNFVALPESRMPTIINVCRSSNVPGGAPGLYRFQIRGGGVATGCTGAGLPCTVPGQRGACGMGVTICSGMSTTCHQVNQPRPRACNGFDNDCDGTIDESNDLCPINRVCDRGQCVDRCQPELGCLTGRTCSDRGTCVETSCVTVTCPVGQRCAGGTCVGLCDGVRCPWAQSCRAGRCVNPCAGIVCDGADVCDSDPGSATVGQCIGGCQCHPCAAGFACQPDGYCSEVACTGVTCPTGRHCEGGMCLDSCATGPDTTLCPAGETCRLGECVGGTAARDGGVVAGRDAGTRVDGSAGGLSYRPADRGCTCHAGAPTADARWSLGALALGAALSLRRRRRRHA